MPDETQPTQDLDQNRPEPEYVDSPGGVALIQNGLAPVVEADEEDHPAEPLPFPLVAIGASKGGIEAFTNLFRNLPADTGMAFVLLLHYPVDHQSDLPRILSGPAKMPVLEMEHGASPQPNHVYVLPPNTRASFERGRFRLELRSPDERMPMPIDYFFRSLAADQKNRAIGIVLSGSDSDGALGLRTLKGEGGIAIVQDPDSAQVEDMPLNSIRADHVDLVLPPHEIASELSRLAQQFFQPSLQLLEQGNLAPGDEPHFARLLTLLRSVSGLEFRHYKAGTLRRRTARRLLLRRMDSLAEYVRFLQESREELRSLHEDVLINVTQFFRDSSVFEALQADILPTLFDKRPSDQQVRIWIAGCSTGEEAYSVAICLLEYLAGQPHEPPIQIFGTDASERSIEMARMALYPDSIAKGISPERLRRFFVKTDKGYQISKRVRDLCIFARQNLCNDPPFSRLDLITCRNVLIYLDREIQSRIVTTFHYALKSNGCLLLGRSESVTDPAGMFTPVDRKNKFYTKLGQGTPEALAPARKTVSFPSKPLGPSPVHRIRAHGLEVDLQKAADRIVIARHAPPGVIVDESLEVLEVRGRPAPFLAVAPGAASLHLLRMAHGDIMPVIRDTVRRAAEAGAPALEDVSVQQDGESISATLEVVPIQAGSGDGAHYLVLFVPLLAHGRLAAPSRTAEFAQEEAPGVEDSSRELARVARDLTMTRSYLQSLIEERDTRNQELTAAYEEIQSSNEELQSTNEELETAKEELQSTNEELQTVNDELRNRNGALVQASNDLTNLLNSVNIPVVMLGSDLTIRQYTPPAERLMRLRPSDIGRPIAEIRLNLSIEDIEPLLHEVLETLVTKELDVQDRSGRWHLLRVRPYRTADNKIDGVVIVMLDVHQMRRTQQDLQQTRDFAQTVVESIQIPVVVVDRDLRIRSANAAFRALAALPPADVERRSFAELLTMLWDWPDLRPVLHDLIANQDGFVLEREHQTTHTPIRNLRLIARAVFNDTEPALLVILDDRTAQKQAEGLLQAEGERLAGEVRSTTEVLGRTREELRALAAKLFTSQEEERRRVARELHDDFSQKLALLEMGIEQLRLKVPTEQEAVRVELDHIRQGAGQLSRDVRSLSHRLHPSMLDHFGLSSALRTLVEEFAEREGMVATFRRMRAPDKVEPEVATNLYRIAQEALRNVAKYAGRTHVKVLFEGTDDGIRLSIHDFGEGFDMDGDATRGLGLVSMGERARLIGGSLAIRSELGQGTSVTVTVPLAAESITAE